MSDPYWRAVTALGRIDGSADVDLDGLDPERLHRLLVQSKVVRLAVPRVKDSRLADLLRATDEAERHRHSATAELTRDVIAAAAQTGARVIKGMAMRPQYPDPEARHVGDIDLHVTDWAATRVLVTHLRAEGWPWDLMEYPWLKWDESGLLYGQLGFLRCSGKVPFARVDIHIGAYSVGHAGRMPLTGWETIEVLGVPVPIPNRENAIALIAAHALGDTRLSMKDINDLHVLIGDGHLDWTSVIELCRCANAVEVLGQLLAELKVIYPQPRLVPQLKYEPRLEPTDRGAHFAWHTYGDELARGASAERAATLAHEAQRYFASDLRPYLSRAADRLPLGRNVCWRLLPEQLWAQWGADTPITDEPIDERQLAEDLVLRQQGSAQIVLIGSEVFVPTVWGDVSSASIRLAAQTVKETR